MGSAGVSGTVTILDQRSYIKIETLRGKSPTEIHGALTEVCDEFTVHRSTVSRWGNRFRGGCVSIDNDPRTGRPRTSTDERSVKRVADALEEEVRQLLVAGPLILHVNTRPHIADVVTKKLPDYRWEVLPHAP